MSAGVQKTMLKSIITSLLDHSKPLYKYEGTHHIARVYFLIRKDNVRALLILLQNPIFSAQSTYTVFAHVLQVNRFCPPVTVHLYSTVKNSTGQSTYTVFAHVLQVNWFCPPVAVNKHLYSTVENSLPLHLVCSK